MIKPYLLFYAFFLIIHALPTVAQEATPAGKAGDIFNKSRKLYGADAVEEAGLVSIGGIQQWISVRGRSKDNPVLLFLHGGPGFTVLPVSYYYMRDWEEFFTVVQWDQRGAGKTYFYNYSEKTQQIFDLDRMVLDTEELIDYLKRKYKKRKIILMAHSFGSLLGVKLAQKHPGWFYAYVGMGQFVDFERSEKYGFEQTLVMARKDNNAEAVKALLSIAPFPDPQRPERNFQNMPIERRWLATYGGYYWESKFGSFNDIASMSPDYSAEELQSRNVAQAYSGKMLWDELANINLMSSKIFKCPVVILQGRHDLGTASFLVNEWFSNIKAPSKKIVWFEDASHMVYEEAPGKTLITLVNDVLPLTFQK